MSHHADYGIDAPPVIRKLSLRGAELTIIGIVAFLFLSEPRWLRYILGYWGLFGGAFMLLTALLMVWSSKIGKLHMRRVLVDSLHLKGDETVLDVGCGHGLLLIEAAKHLPNGKAIGVDLWQSVDQSGNRPEVTLENARVEGVAEHVEVNTGDMCNLPLPDASVDITVASLSIHNIPDMAGRARAIREIHRVLKPGGRIALLDLQATDKYIATFRSLGWETVRRSGLNFWMFPPVRVVRGKKPA